MPKDTDSLGDSRDIRQYLISKWGCLPSSIWKVNWNVKVKDFSRSYADHQKEQAEKYGKSFSLSSVGHGKEGGLSRFPQDLCQFLVKFYTSEGDTILDPFTGHNSRMESCYKLNRNYIGFDISQQFMDWNLEVYRQLQEENASSMYPIEASVVLHREDSRDLLGYIQPESVDFCITSPPFYDLEYYGDEPEQLGRAKLYTDFLRSLGQIAGKCFVALKQGKYIAWEVNDFRRKGTFHTYHADLITLFNRCGFTMHDVIVVDYGSSLLSSFLSDVEHNKITPKQHSYIIVAKKPATPHTKPNREQTRERLLDETNSDMSVAKQSSF